MVLDAILAYLHFIAIFVLFAFLAVQWILLRRRLDEPAIRLLGRMDLGYFGAAIAALATGFLRLGMGPKGGEVHLAALIPLFAVIMSRGLG